MKSASMALLGLLLAGVGVCPLQGAPQATAKAPGSIRRVAVLGKGNSAEIEITATRASVPAAQVVTGPDRLVIDFPNTLPGAGFHKIIVPGGPMTAVRVGLFRASPPITRVVIDLKTPQPYQLFPSGNTVIVKFGADAKPAPVAAQPDPNPLIGTVEGAKVTEPIAIPPTKPQPRVQVEFRNGNLRISTEKATLAEVLFEVHKRTGADIPIPAGAEQEEVAAHLGPGPAREVLAALLNGSKFNFIMVGSDSDPLQLSAVLLSPRGSPMPQPTGNYTAAPTSVAQANPRGRVQEPAPDPDPDDLPPDMYHEDDPLSGDQNPPSPNPPK